MSTHPVPSFLKAFPHGIDITAPGGIDELLAFHHRTFGDAQMNAAGADGGEQSKPEQKPDRVFTQEELNRILADDRRKHTEKYADYDDLKAKAAKLDEKEAENQTELQKAIARAEKAERDRDEEKRARALADHQALAANVALAKGVPVAHISGTTREELEASADQLIAWRGGQPVEKTDPPKVGAHIPLAGTGQTGPRTGPAVPGRERAAARHQKNN